MKWISLLLSLCLPVVAAANDDDWDDLLARCDAHMRQAQQTLIDEHQAATFERFDIDLDRGEFVFSHGGVPRLVARVVMVGTYSHTSQTWLWGWADSRRRPGWKNALDPVRALGKQHGYKHLVQRRWPADTGDAQDMAAVAHCVLNGKGMYRVPNKATASFEYWVFTDLRPAKP